MAWDDFVKEDEIIIDWEYLENLEDWESEIDWEDKSRGKRKYGNAGTFSDIIGGSKEYTKWIEDETK